MRSDSGCCAPIRASCEGCVQRVFFHHLDGIGLDMMRCLKAERGSWLGRHRGSAVVIASKHQLAHSSFKSFPQA